MRITTANAYESSIANLQRRQQQLSVANAHLTSGKRVLNASDDPTSAARAERALAQMMRSEANQRSLDASRSAMQLTEAALGDGVDLMHYARSLVVQAGSGTMSAPDRLIVAEQLRGVRDDLLRLANRNDGAGRYLFGGQGSDVPPLADTPGGVVYQGSTGALHGDAGETTLLALDGAAVWLQVPDPANPGANLSLFQILDDAVAQLSDPAATSVDVGQSVSQALARIDVVTTNLSGWRARAGEALNRNDAIQTRLSQAMLDAKQSRMEAEDLDIVQALSDFQNQQSGYDAALKTYSIVQRMSLFDYMK